MLAPTPDAIVKNQMWPKAWRLPVRTERYDIAREAPTTVPNWRKALPIPLPTAYLPGGRLWANALVRTGSTKAIPMPVRIDEGSQTPT